jgi:hypothetical protein
VKPFVCSFPECGMAFGFKKVLERHELTHTQPAPPRERKKSLSMNGIIEEIVGVGFEGRKIECWVDECSKLFFRDYDLRRHLASVHGISLEGENGGEALQNEEIKEIKDEVK